MPPRRALVCAPRMPEFDREGGSRRIFHLIDFFTKTGWAVSFVAEHANSSPRYAYALQQKGVATYALHEPWPNGEEALIDFEQLVQAGCFDLILFAFWSYAENYLPLVRALAPSARIVIDSVDVHFLRQARRVF